MPDFIDLSGLSRFLEKIKTFIINSINTHNSNSTVHNATSLPTNSTIILRDSSGRAQIIAPLVAADIANKGYVDNNKVGINNNLTTTGTGTALDAYQGYLLDANKANLASPVFSGTPTTPTATSGTNSTQIASTAFVQTAVASLSTPVIGSYTGTGVDNRTISLGFTPKAVFVWMSNVATMNSVYGGLATTGAPSIAATGYNSVDITTNGFIIRYRITAPVIYTNTSGTVYSYIAWK